MLIISSQLSAKTQYYRERKQNPSFGMIKIKVDEAEIKRFVVEQSPNLLFAKNTLVNLAEFMHKLNDSLFERTSAIIRNAVDIPKKMHKMSPDEVLPEDIQANLSFSFKKILPIDFNRGINQNSYDVAVSAKISEFGDSEPHILRTEYDQTYSDAKASVDVGEPDDIIRYLKSRKFSEFLDSYVTYKLKQSDIGQELLKEEEILKRAQVEGSKAKNKVATYDEYISQKNRIKLKEEIEDIKINP